MFTYPRGQATLGQHPAEIFHVWPTQDVSRDVHPGAICGGEDAGICHQDTEQYMGGAHLRLPRVWGTSYGPRIESVQTMDGFSYWAGRGGGWGGG